MELARDYLASAVKRFRQYKDLGEKAIVQVTEENIGRAPNDDSNSIAVIVQHLSGNMVSRWTDFLTTDGEKPWRNRDGEFEGSITTREELLRIWEKGWQCALEGLEQLSPDDLAKTVLIRSENLSVLDAIQRQLGHAAYHVGQIVYAAKMWQQEGWQTLSIPRKK